MEKVKAFPPRSGTSQGCPLFATIIQQYCFEITSHGIQKRKDK